MHACPSVSCLFGRPRRLLTSRQARAARELSGNASHFSKRHAGQSSGVRGFGFQPRFVRCRLSIHRLCRTRRQSLHTHIHSSTRSKLPTVNTSFCIRSDHSAMLEFSLSTVPLRIVFGSKKGLVGLFPFFPRLAGLDPCADSQPTSPVEHAHRIHSLGSSREKGRQEV
jgi:hypothetical protein